MINTGHGVTLAPLLEKQLGQMLVWRNDRRIWKWCRQNSVISEAQHVGWFRSLPTRPDVRMFSIIADNGDFVGVCGLTSIDYINSRAEVSLYIAPDRQRTGLGSQAMRTLIDHAFLDLNLHQVWGESFAESPANGLAEKLGFERTGVRPSFYYREGAYVSTNMYHLLRGTEKWAGFHLV
jgi:RimJ/RimL family protein N-acetyltransferase